MRIFIVVAGTVLGTSLGREEASNFLKRKPRVLDDLYLESQPDNFERECAEKRCDTEEFDELYDFETGLVKVTFSPTVGGQRDPSNQVFTKTIFQNSYPEFPIHVTKPCYEFTNGTFFIVPSRYYRRTAPKSFLDNPQLILYAKHTFLGFDNNTLRKTLLKECVENMTKYPEIARRVAFSATTAPAKSLCKAFRWSSPTNCDP